MATTPPPTPPATAMASAPLMLRLMPRLTMATTDTLALPLATVPDMDMVLDSGPTPPQSTVMPALDTVMVPATAMASAPLMLRLMPRLTMATTDTLALPLATVPDSDMVLDSGPTPPQSTVMPALDTVMVPATAMASAPLMLRLMPRLTM